MQTVRPAAMLIAASLVLAGGAALAARAATGPTVSISTPTEGQRVSARRDPYLAIAGAASLATPAATSTRFYLRRDGCGTSGDNPHLSIVDGTDAGDGCGLTLTSVVGAGGTVDQDASVDYPSTDGMPLTLDGSRPLTGTIDLRSISPADPLAAGTGLLTVTVELEALHQGDGESLGSDSESVLMTPTQSDYPVAFTIRPNGALDRADLSGVDLRVHVEGPFVAGGFIGNSGRSFLDVPAFTASFARSVEVSLDDPSFASPLPARLSDTTWSLAIPTPSPGYHVLYARATQGFDTGPTATRDFRVGDGGRR